MDVFPHKQTAAIQTTPSVQEETHLIRQIVAGRGDLFCDLIEPHLPVLRSMIKAKMGNDPDLEDVMQQVVYKAWTHLDRFRFEARFRTWLIRIALNEILHHARRRRALAVSLDTYGLNRVQGDPEDSPFRFCALNQSIRLLHAALSRLPDKYRVIVDMCDLEGRPTAEVAKMMRLTLSAVKSRRHRGWLQMARLLSFTRSGPFHVSTLKISRAWRRKTDSHG